MLAAIGPTAIRATAVEIRAVDLGGLEARSAALLLSGQEAGDLEASFLARSVASPEAESSILVVADLVGASLLEAAAGAEMIVEVYAYALDEAGQPRATLTRAFRLDLSAHQAGLETGGVKFLGRIELPAGIAASTLRLLVLHRASGRLALRTLSLSSAAAQPEEPGSQTRISVLERADSWLVAGGTDDSRTAVSEGRWLPATRLVATAGGSLSLGLAAEDPASIVGRILDTEGQPLGDLDLRLPRAPGVGLAALEALVELSQWPPGSYLLEIVGGAGPEAVLRLPLELVPEQLAEGAAWFQSLPARKEEVAATDTGPRVAGRWALIGRALAAYQRAFDSWLAGGPEDALAELRRFEAGATSIANSVSLSIEEGQIRAAAKLVTADEEALVPLMCLHELLYRFYRTHDEPRLATHSQRLASEFARLYAARSGRDAGRIAALVQVSLAGVRQDSGARHAAQSAFERALELDPRQPEALLGLAALHESFAHYDTTVELLRRLDRAGALSPAAKIRLAVNLGRVGSTRQALELLGELADAQPEWISRLAYQERARLLAGSQRADEALPVLVEARQRYPDDQALTIQQAALLDQLGQPLAGQRVLAAIDDLTADRGDSPRLRYSALPSRQIEAARTRLARAAVERLPGVLEKARAILDGGSQ